jgi:hypothetical protein
LRLVADGARRVERLAKLRFGILVLAFVAKQNAALPKHFVHTFVVASGAIQLLGLVEHFRRFGCLRLAVIDDAGTQVGRCVLAAVQLNGL